MRTLTRLKSIALKQFPRLKPIQRWLYQFKPYRSKFRAYYLDEGWGAGESRSGPGSTMASTERIREALPHLFTRFGIRSVVDVPCGDFHWMKAIDLQGISYLGVDIVPELVAENQARYGGPGVRFVVGDILTAPVPRADLIVCRDCLFHYRNRDIVAALAQFRQSGARYLLTTTFPDVQENVDLEAIGLFRPINLEKAPFSLSAPLELIAENQPRKAMGLWDLRAQPESR